MTSKELNRDVKKLWKNINKRYNNVKANTKNITIEEYFAYVNNEARTEFLRLYQADNKFEYMSKSSILMMLRLNLRHEFEPKHMFGIYIAY